MISLTTYYMYIYIHTPPILEFVLKEKISAMETQSCFFRVFHFLLHYSPQIYRPWSAAEYSNIFFSGVYLVHIRMYLDICIKIFYQIKTAAFAQTN